MTNLTGHALGDAVGKSLEVEWSLPKSYAIETVRLTRSRHLQDSRTGQRMISEEPGPFLPATATSGTIQMPISYCCLTLIGLDVNVIVEGVNGERSVAIYSFR